MLAIMKSQLKRLFTSPMRIFIILIAPIVAMIIFMNILNTAEKEGSFSIGVVDEDKSAISKDLIEYIEETAQVNYYENTDVGEKSMEKALEGNSEIAVFLIEKGFGQALVEGDRDKAKVEQFVLRKQDITDSLKNIVNGYIDKAYGLAKSMDKPGQEDLIKKIDDIKGSGFTYKFYDEYDEARGSSLGFGMVLMLMIYNAFSMVYLLLEDRENNTFNRIRRSPISRYDIIAANILVGLLIYTVNAVSLYLFMTFGLGQRVDAFLFVLMILVSITFHLIALAIGFLIRSKNQMGNIQGFIPTVTCMLGGCFWSLSMMPDKIIKLSYLTPQYWLMSAVEAYVGGDKMPYINLLALVAFVVLSFSLAAYVLKKMENEEYI